MALSSDLISQFVQVTKKEKQNKETTVYGTIKEYNGGKYVQLDGSELLTPISTTADALDGEKVTVMIKDHTAIVTGNLSSPSARTGTVKEMGNKISEFEVIIADKVSVSRLEAEIARIDTLVSENVTIKGRLDANEANIQSLTANNATINGKLTAAEANIGKLQTDKLNVSDADLKYANIDFANINMTSVKKLFTDSGIIKDLVVSDGKITGELVGVTIKGDLIEANTVKADKLVIKGSDGLYYKLNVDSLGETTASSDVKYQNGLDGSVIIAKSIVAEKIAVDDLVAFGATIGGFHISEKAIYSGVKTSVNNTFRGIYIDNDGQFSVGDSNNYLKFFKDTDEQYKLQISASSMSFSSSGKTVEEEINNLKNEVSTAAKTATNFMGYDEANGLQIGNKISGEWSGYRTQVKSDSFNILDSNNVVVASYGTNSIELGKNNNDCVISLYNDKGKIQLMNNGFDRYYLQISSQNLSFPCENLQLHSEFEDGEYNKFRNIEITGNGSISIENQKSLKINPNTIIRSSISMRDDGKIDIESTDTISFKGDVLVHDNFNVLGGGIELNNSGSLSNYGGFIDFHYNKSASDYTSRIIEDADGQLNLIANNGVKVNGNIIESGTWTPSCAAIHSPTKAFGSYMRIGESVTINFFIYGIASSGSGTGSLSLRITGLPFSPNKNVRWYSGGGNAAGIETPANYSFCGFSIEHDTNSSTNYGSIILPRCTQMTTAAGIRSSNYCTNPGSGTIYMSGTIMYSTT